jgi:hypothetical protein
MEETIETATSEAKRDLSPEWLEFLARVRSLARGVAAGPAAGDARDLARESLKLCAHVERLHAGFEHLLAGSPAPEARDAPDSGRHREGLSDEDKAALKIQRELHEPSSVRDVIKALFLWQDYPEERMGDDERTY